MHITCEMKFFKNSCCIKKKEKNIENWNFQFKYRCIRRQQQLPDRLHNWI